MTNMEKNQNKALWIFPNFKETIDTIPQKYRGRAWEMLLEYGFSGEIDLSKENKYIQIVVKSLIPLIRLRGVGGSIGGKSNNPTGKKKANVAANVGANVAADVGATPYKHEQEHKQEHKHEQEHEQERKHEGKVSNIFSKPSIDEIKNYCLERNNQINAEQFYDYYESKGWLIGKSKMKDWKAAIRTWERNGFSKPEKQEEEFKSPYRYADTGEPPKPASEPEGSIYRYFD